MMAKTEKDLINDKIKFHKRLMDMYDAVIETETGELKESAVRLYNEHSDECERLKKVLEKMI